ncbi:LysR substrate-binding domain-containing protein [Roseovarius aestuariivivens]|uniref:LysR substrate-binding domain-containing protein n=1 Tax=Roseovarius aestuariivivens TaxID=1888910 RepID=UPI001436921E|nr:LysR substrate-binding domain-containing protein [Roseovarius aestuariivivens]
MGEPNSPVAKRKLPPFPALRAFEAAARLGAFKDAAEELCVTPSAVSHQVKVLETFVGRALFERETRAVRLTRDGRDYLELVGPILDALDASTRRVAGEAATGVLHLHMTEGFMKRWLMPRLGRFMTAHPSIEIRMERWMPPTEFRGGAPDVIVHWGDAPVPGVEVTPFLSSSRIPLCSPAYLRANPDLTRPEALLKKVLLRDEVEDGWPEWFGLLGRARECPRGGPVFAHCELSTCAAENGLGVVLGYKHMIGETLSRGTLVAPFEIESPTRTIYSIAVEATRMHEPKIVAFRDWVLDEAMFDRLPGARVLNAAQ